MSMNLSPTAPRSLSGCWTCRLRRKKCDEAHPSCQTCINLELDCSGYGSKPKWMDGGSAQALLQHEIKMQVKKRASLKRDARLLKLTQDKRRGSAPSTEERATDGDSITTDASSESVGFSEELLRPVGDDFRLPFRQDWHGTPPLSTLSDGFQASTEACVDITPTFEHEKSEQYLFRYFWARVFASHFAYLPFSVAYAGCKWLSYTMTKVQPLSDLTLALSAYHCRIRTLFSTVKDDSTWRYYYDHGLSGLRIKLHSFRKGHSLQGIRGALQLLACNMQLILLDLLRGLGTWVVHLRGMSELMDMVIAFLVSRESEELGCLDRNGLEFIVQVYAPFDRASALLNMGIPSFDRTEWA